MFTRLIARNASYFSIEGDHVLWAKTGYFAGLTLVVIALFSFTSYGADAGYEAQFGLRLPLGTVYSAAREVLKKDKFKIVNKSGLKWTSQVKVEPGEPSRFKFTYFYEKVVPQEPSSATLKVELIITGQAIVNKKPNPPAIFSVTGVNVVYKGEKDAD